MTPFRSAVVMACDAGYLPYALALATSIRRWHPDGGLDLVLASEEPLLLPSGTETLGLRLLPVPENPFRGGPGEDRHGSATYLRLVVPDLLAADYDRLLYLDSDILCTGPGLDRLLSVGMGGLWLAAVRDNTQWRTPGRRLPEFRAMGRPARPYFNAGVVMIDVARWRAEGVLEKALELFRTQPEVLPRHDQSILNLLADGRWVEMCPIWNWQYTWSSRFFADLAEPRLVHFIGPRKPWTEGGAQLPARFRRPFSEMLVTHFPDHPPMPDPESLGWPNALRRSLLKHWLAEPAMRRYLARFSGPLDLKPAA